MNDKIYIVIPTDEVIQRRKHRLDIIITLGIWLCWLGILAIYFLSVVCNYRNGQSC